jgi:hypothetical protein
MATSLGIISLPSPWIGSQIWEQFGPKVPFVLTAVLGALALVPAWLKLVVPTTRESAAEVTQPTPVFRDKSLHAPAGVVATPDRSGGLAPLTDIRMDTKGASSPPESPKVPPFPAGTAHAYVTVLTGVILGLRPSTLTDPDRIFPLIAGIVGKYRGRFHAHGADGFVAVFGSEATPTRPQITALLATQAALDVADYLQSIPAQNASGPRSIRLSMGIATGLSEPSLSATKGETPPSGTTRQTADRLQRMAMRAETASLLICGETYGFLANARAQFAFGRFGKTPAQVGLGEVMLYEVLGRRSIRTERSPFA